MKFTADLHIHSKYSIATSKTLDFENLYIAAQLKGIHVVGTGDMTHPEWFNEAREKLVTAEQGLYRLKDHLSKACDMQVPLLCRSTVRFMLTAEISNIYKKKGKTRKNHNLVFLPNLETAEAFNQKLDRIGNIKADGRPILGLDARNLLEILLETSDQAFLVPAHIWTPWFSVLGSKSGFDSVSDCFDDLTPYIFAVETGLSSDPEMNWRVSGLDGLTLISNSDAHSPMKLGREANLFDTELSFSAIKTAIQTGDKDKFIGTFEFYPDQGKYHLDGHRKCQVRVTPEETVAAGGNCPVCGKPLTLGVLHRVAALSDRKIGVRPKKALPFYNLVPLTDILSEILKVGPNAKKVMKSYHGALSALGSEFDILHYLPIEKIKTAGIALLPEAILKIRQKKINVSGGYDGEFGKVHIFTAQERARLLGQKSLFAVTGPEKNDAAQPVGETSPVGETPHGKHPGSIKALPGFEEIETSIKTAVREKCVLNKDQKLAVEYSGGPLMIVAGPGTGKTLTLTHRIYEKICNQNVLPENILAVTFTNKAAQEMKKRLAVLMGSKKNLPLVATFHSLCLKIIKESEQKGPLGVIDDKQRRHLIHDAVHIVESAGMTVPLKKKRLFDLISKAKTKMADPESYAETMKEKAHRAPFTAVYRAYERLLGIQGLHDFEDLIAKVVERLERDDKICQAYRRAYPYIFVDEYQDLNLGQYRLIRALAPKDKDICVIGDPDQAIYGFRGSNVAYFSKFIKDHPRSRTIHLTRNYRSTETILQASDHVIGQHSLSDSRWKIFSGIEGVKTITIIGSGSDTSEAAAVGRRIEKMIGGTGFHAMDFGRVDGTDSTASFNFSDFAVLFRSREQIKIFSNCFENAGIPFQVATKKYEFEQKNIYRLVSLLRFIEGAGNFIDFENISPMVGSGLPKKIVHLFKHWGYDKQFSLNEALVKSKAFPIQGMKIVHQQRLNAFLNELEGMKTAVSGLSLSQKLTALAQQTNLLEKRETTAQLRASFERLVMLAQNFNGDSPAFFTHISLQTDTDVYEAVAEKVALMTMHAAKGLEFPVVFIAGCENGFIPLIRPGLEDTDMDEERRLFFVAMTRAKQQLFLTHAKNRKIFGQLEDREISPFVASIAEALIYREAAGLKRKKGPRQEQLKLF